MPDSKAALPQHPDLVLTWETLLTDGLRALHAHPKGLYVVMRRDDVLYVGRSYRLPLRVGELIQGVIGGLGTHTAASAMHAAGIRPADVTIAVYFGIEVYLREAEIMRALKPQFGARYRRDEESGEWVQTPKRSAIKVDDLAGLDPVGAATRALLREILGPPKDPSERLASLRAQYGLDEPPPGVDEILDAVRSMGPGEVLDPTSLRSPGLDEILDAVSGG